MPQSKKRRAYQLAWQRKNKDKIAGYTKKWRRANPEKNNDSKRNWEKKNPEKVRAMEKRKYKKHGKKIRSSRKERYHLDIDASRAALRARHARIPWVHMLPNIKKRANKKGLTFDLTNEWFKSRWSGKCELTGIPFLMEPGRPGPSMFSPSVDRIDSRLGYTQQNCRIILFAVNAMKVDGTDTDMFMIAKRLAACAGG